MLRGGVPRPIGNFPESLSQAILVGVMLVGRLGVVGVELLPWATQDVCSASVGHRYEVQAAYAVSYYTMACDAIPSHSMS